MARGAARWMEGAIGANRDGVRAVHARGGRLATPPAAAAGGGGGGGGGGGASCGMTLLPLLMV